VRRNPIRPDRLSTAARRGAAALLAACAGLAAGAPTAETIRIGASAQGLPIEVIALGEPGPDAQGLTRDQRPALLIVAGLQAHHDIGRAAAMALADRLIADHPDLLAGRTVYILPEANPDGRARWTSRGLPRAESGRVPQVTDADRDGRPGEDPGEDLNNDGLITMMRVPASNPQAVRYNLSATHIIDPDDARLLRAPKPAGGESATHALLIEGIDNDNDGAFNEDGWGGSGGGGIDLDRHFPTHWPEHTDGAGLHPLARPEARALVEWSQARFNIVGVLVYGPHDTLAAVPPSGKFPPPGRVPSGIEEDDKAWHEKISEFYKKTTGAPVAAEGPSRDGSFLQWAYADLGVFAFGTPVWRRPEPAKGDADAPVALTPEPAAADPVAADRAALAERGVPQELIDFIHATLDEREAIVAEMETMTPEQRNERMNLLRQAPMDIQQRVMAIAQGQPDPMPPQPPPTEPAPAVIAPPAEKPAARPTKRGDSEDAKWLAWIDDHRSGEGFIDWQPFDHPQLGPVEVGGFVPGVRVNPPQDAVPALIDRQTAFVAGLLERLPALEFDAPMAEHVGPGLWRISLTARNTGLLPTAAAIGVKARRLHPLVFALDPAQTIPPDHILSGSRLARFDALDGSGATARAEWLVFTGDASEVRIEVRSAHFGNRGFDVPLSDSANGGDR
jgi:hypothetical protein